MKNPNSRQGRDPRSGKWVRWCRGGTWKVSCLLVLWCGPSLICKRSSKRLLSTAPVSFPSSGPFEHALIVGPRAFREAQLHDAEVHFLHAPEQIISEADSEHGRRRCPPPYNLEEGGRGTCNWFKSNIQMRVNIIHQVKVHNTYQRGEGRGGVELLVIVVDHGCCCL